MGFADGLEIRDAEASDDRIERLRRAGERVTRREQAAGVLGNLRDAFRHHALLAGPNGQPRHGAERGERDSGIDARVEAIGRQAREMAADRRRDVP